jgi:peptidoglycan/LPS O-acetylase OafA/YrhL
VLAVLGYHLGVPHMGGGLLGVGVFFTLSGFLITGILLATWERTGGLELRTFWLRRARRLLPAVVLVLAVVLAVTTLVARGDWWTRAGESAAALFYVSNWQTIFSGSSYFDRFDGPGPLDHLWSLAIEEQFYLVWPLLLLLFLRVLRGRRLRVALVTTALAAVSFVLLWGLAEPGFDNTRVYEGTDTRAGGLLIGAALAMVWRPTPGAARVSQGARWVLDGAGGLALVVIGVLVYGTDDYSLSLYGGGLLLLSAATAVLVGVAVHPASRVGRALGIAPLRWVGERSYGIYLWHLPVIAFMPAVVLSGQPVLRGGLQFALTLLIAAASWSLLEDPIRRHGLVAALRGVPTSLPVLQSAPATDIAPAPRRPLVPPLVSGTVGLAVLATGSLAAGGLVAPEREGAEDMVSASSVVAPQTPDPVPTPAAVPAISAAPTATPSSAPTAAAPSPVAARAASACKKVVHVGDSTSTGLVSSNVLPRPGDRVDAQYARVGATGFGKDISGAMSIVETYKGQPNAETRVVERVRGGYEGCWVVAMGINEVANQAVGGVVSLEERIDTVMRHLGSQPVLWTTVRTLRSSGPYADAGMKKWNAALVKACRKYPSMRVYDWRSEVRKEWYIPDGIHFTSDGYRARALRLANALARAFPAAGTPPSGCLVTGAS